MSLPNTPGPPDATLDVKNAVPPPIVVVPVYVLLLFANVAAPSLVFVNPFVPRKGPLNVIEFGACKMPSFAPKSIAALTAAFATLL